MDFLPVDIEEYIEKNTQEEPELLAKLNRDTWANVLIPRMLAGHLQGRVISMFSHMVKPTRVLEVGTFTGYSALCWAEGLTEEGKIHTIDINEELENMVGKYFEEAGVNQKIELHIGNAVDIIPTLEEEWDIVYIDADKENYSNYYDLVFDSVLPGGYIIADNVLWSGKVVEANPDEETASLQQYAKKIHTDDRVENVMLPVRDGLLVARKI